MSHLAPHFARVDDSSAPLFPAPLPPSSSCSSSSDDELEDEGVITLAQDAEPRRQRKRQKQQEQEQEQHSTPKTRISFKTAGKVLQRKQHRSMRANALPMNLQRHCYHCADM